MGDEKIKLTIELVPKSCWYSNLRSELSSNDWKKISRESYIRAGYRCQICGGKGNKWPVEAHEIWAYDDYNMVQSLRGIISLCPDCHMVKHIGLSEVRGLMPRAIGHIMKINRWSEENANLYVQDAFAIWEKRSQYDWRLDLSWLEGRCIDIKD